MQQNTTSDIHTIILAFIMLAAVALVATPLSKTHALSCLNPEEMVEDFATEDRFAITHITAGELTTGTEFHTQSVTVVESYKGSIDETVSFAYDDTWQYLCAGNPTQTGDDAIYITVDGQVSQVVQLDSPLEEALLEALETTPAPETPETPTTTTDLKQSLMQQVVALLQKLITLLQSEPTDVTETGSPEALIGMTDTAAAAYAAKHDIMFRVVNIDGEPQAVTEDYRPGRINASVENDVVVSYTVEGNGELEETPTQGEHDDIIGMTEEDARAYAEALDIPFRIGRIDDEFMPVTMDYRPGRITASLEEEVVVDYSVE